ncbi:unnamed protein product [Owenia fusiformis]|uniref:Uncharacterized protein n=1 Tax=Owenia fusiformis TaxID=6347 RepID=A0A8S4Q3T0_OWEFU|nr:unnamed protein product [Owenia fusiformis]
MAHSDEKCLDMAVYGSCPSWLLNSKSLVTNSKEWNEYVGELHDVIQQQLTESHVQHFTDLSQPEKMLFMDRASQALHTGNAARQLAVKLNNTMETEVNKEVNQKLLDDSSAVTKTDVLLEHSQEGAVSLLKKWPDLKMKLHVCLNRLLPMPLRQITWRLFLNNTKARRKYVDLLTSNPRMAISDLDLEISHKCEQLLNSEPTFQQFKGSVGAFYAMKAVLSYYHSQLPSGSTLLDIDYMLMVPFMQVAGDNIPRREPGTDRVVALLVEEFETFMESRPSYMLDGSQDRPDEMSSFMSRVCQYLQLADPDTAKILSEALNKNKEHMVETELSMNQLLVDQLTPLVQPLLRAFFTGYTSMEVVGFIWDQYMIGLDVPGFNNEYLPAIMATFLMLLRDSLKPCTNASEVDEVLCKEGVKLQPSQFQYMINRHFYRDLFSYLSQNSVGSLPILDPTKSEVPAWNYTRRLDDFDRTKAQDRRRNREERDQERDRQRQQRLQDEQQRLVDTNRDGSGADARRIAAKERMHLEDLIDQERRRRQEAERVAAQKIEDLQREINDLKNRKTADLPKKMKSPNPSIYSVQSTYSRYLIPPPPSPASNFAVTPVQAWANERLKTPTPTKPKKEQTADVVLDFLKRIAVSVNKVCHADGADRRHLDSETKRQIKAHQRDVKAAEMEVFGHPLRSGEFESLTEEERQEKADQLMSVIKRMLEEREPR